MADARKLKHLELVQGVINRLSTNSFLLKGWSVFLISALLALSTADNRAAFGFIAYIPAVVFWSLGRVFSLAGEALSQALRPCATAK